VETSKSNILPYPWVHHYNVILQSRVGIFTHRYILHCDYRKAKDKRNITELKKRLAWSFSGCHIKQICPIPRKSRANKYLYEIKKENNYETSN
jgi:hypothetical protein